MADVLGYKVSYNSEGQRVCRRLIDLVIVNVGTQRRLYAITVCRFSGCLEVVDVADAELKFEVARDKPVFD